MYVYVLIMRGTYVRYVGYVWIHTTMSMLLHIMNYHTMHGALSYAYMRQMLIHTLVSVANEVAANSRRYFGQINFEPEAAEGLSTHRVPAQPTLKRVGRPKFPQCIHQV